jgi:hypothetical protein
MVAGDTTPYRAFAYDRSLNRHTGDIPTENINEALYLFAVAAIGLFLNISVIVCILTCKRLRKMTNSFIMHGAILDIIKCAYCVPFAQSLLMNIAPSFCTVLGGSYVIIVTASGFNIVAMVCCEAYAFSEHNVGREGRGSFCCVIFGVFMVYIGSIIIHLGPTIIGGDFDYNDLIGNCIFVYGTIKSYVVHAMWICIMTLAMVGAVYYLIFFYRHVQANSTHRLASLVRASIAVSRGNTNADTNSIRKLVRDSLSRARVLMTITALFIFCWYPLFILTLVDPKFAQPTKVYKLLTFIAWSNSTINPLVLILFDKTINIFRRMPCCLCFRCPLPMEDGPEMPLVANSSRGGSLSRSSSRNVNPPLSMAQVYQRVGCRLCQEGQSHSNTQCNGGVARSSVVRDTSICELHSFS